MNDIEQKLLTLQGDDLSRLLGSVLQPEVITCPCTDWFEPEAGSLATCGKCGYRVTNTISLIDWNIAMKWMVVSIELCGKKRGMTQ